MSLSLAWHIVRKKFSWRYGKSDAFLEEVVGNIWALGYEEALRCFDPDRGATFKTFLYAVFANMAKDERKKFFSRFSKMPRRITVTAREVNSKFGIPLPKHTRYVFDFSGNDYFRPPFGFRLPASHESLNDESDDESSDEGHPASSPSETWEMVRYTEFLECVGRINDTELKNINRRRLPPYYKKLTQDALRKQLAELDQQIVKLLMYPCGFGRAAKIDIQTELGIGRNFYEFRIESILDRLGTPYESYQRWIAAQKAREKDEAKVCGHRVWAIAQELQQPVVKKFFEFNVPANRPGCFFDIQGQLFVDEVNGDLYVRCDAPDPEENKPVLDDRELDRDPEQWDYVENYVDLFEDE